MRQEPMLMESPLTKRVFIVTSYIDNNGTFTAKVKHDITGQFDALAKMRSDKELIDLAHQAWSMAMCAMHGMPIPADWGNAVEQGLRKHGIDVDSEVYDGEA